MTIASTTVANSGSSTNGATTQFSFAFHIADYGDVEAEDQIVVRLVTTATGAETVLTRGTSGGQYSVSINADQSASPGGSITTITTYASGYKIWIELSPSFLQATDYQNQGGFLMETVEDQADQQARQILVLKDQLRRTPRVNVTAGAGFDGTIAGPFTAGYALTVNGAGDGFALATPVTGDMVSAAMAPVLLSGTTSAALTALGIVSAWQSIAGGTVSAGLATLLATAGVYIPTALTSAAVQTAITTASGAGGGTVLLAPSDYVWSAAVTLPSNVILQGVRGKTRFVGASSSSSFNFLEVNGSQATSLTLNTNASELATAIILDDASTISDSDYVAILTTLASTTNAHYLVTKVIGKSSNTLTLADPLPCALLTTDSPTIRKMTTVTNATVRDIAFALGSNTGTTTQGLQALYCVDCVFENLRFDDFANVGFGLHLAIGHNNVTRNLRFTNCGSGGYGAAQWAAQTGGNFDGMTTIDSPSFGFLMSTCAWSNFSNITAEGSVARGVKFNGSRYCNVSNVVSVNNSTGLAIDAGTSWCSFSNITLASNNQSAGGLGLYHMNAYNERNVYQGVVSLNHSNADIVFAVTDSNNCVRDAIYTTIVSTNVTSWVEETRTGQRRLVTNSQSADTLESLAAGASGGPIQYLYRNKTGASADDIGLIFFDGKDAAGNRTTFATIGASIPDATNGSEDGSLTINTMQAGTLTFCGRFALGLVMGAATGGDKGAGTANFAGDIYKNNTAFTNPDYVFEHFFTGAIDRFAKNEGAAEYGGLMALDDLGEHVKRTLRLPGMTDAPMGAFKRNDFLLEKIEELSLYVIELHERLKAVENK